MKMKLLRWVSRFTDRKIPAGTGVTTDDSLVLSTPVSQNQVEKAQRLSKAVYVLRSQDVTGGFELIGFVKRGETTLYRLHHTLSGLKFDVNKALFELIFEKESR